MKKMTKTVIVGVLCLLMCSAFIFGKSGIKGKHALAESQSVKYDYTDSDYLTEGSSYTIRDYAEKLIGTQAHVQRLDGKYQIVDSEQDDPIVSIIPKDLFYTEGQKLVIGQEYGYYINTSPIDAGYISTAMVFDIITEANLELTTDRAFITIEPLFEYKYVCVSGQDSYIFMGEYKVIYNNSSYCVVPYATIIDSSIRYVESTQYYLKDISFAGTLYNEQHLNPGDTLYDANKDYGSYFTAFDYEYRGKYREGSSFPAGDAASVISDAVQMGIAIAEDLTIAGKVAKTLGRVLSWASLASDTCNYIISKNKWENGELILCEKKVTTSCFYQNRNDQLTHYRDDLGRPALTKSAAVTCNTSKDKSLWYGVGDYAKAIFYIGHGGDGTATNYTRLIDNIALKVVDSSNDEVVKSEIGLGSVSMRDMESKVISIDEPSDAYMLPVGKDSFIFKAQYESDYDVTVDLSSEADISVNGKKYHGNSISIKLHVVSNGRIVIDLSENEVALNGTVKINPNCDTFITQISADQNYILKMDLSGVRKLKTNNPNLEIKELLRLSNGVFSDYSEYGRLEPCDEISYPFRSGTYYVLVHNNSSENFTSQHFSVEDIESLAIGSENSVNLTSFNLNYFKITASSSVNHVISLPDTKGDNFNYIFLNPDLSIGDGRSYIEGMYVVGLEENKTFYFGVKTGAVEVQTTILIKETNNAFQWKIIGNDFGSDGKILSQNNVLVKRGNTYTLSFLINGRDSNATLFSVDSNTSWGYYGFSVNSNRKVVVPVDCPIGGNGITVKAWDSVDNDTSFNHTLKLIPTDEIVLNSIVIENAEDITLTFQAPKFVSKIDYQVSCDGVQATQSITNAGFTRVNTITESLLPIIQIVKYDAPAYVTFKIIKVYYYDAYKNEKSNSNRIFSTTINNLFAGGNGTSNSPYIINCGRHAYNIRKSQSSFFQLKNDITCQNKWTPIENFEGTLDLNNYSISLTNKSVSVNGNYGFINQNNGFVFGGSFKPQITTLTGGSKNYYIGVVAAVNNGTIERCTIKHVSGTDINIKDWYAYFGSIAGYNSGKIKNCTNYAVIRGNCVNFGGIAGFNGGDNNLIYACTNHGKIYGQAEGTTSACFGGIVGIGAEGSNIEQPYNDAALLFDKTDKSQSVMVYIGQIAGRMCKADKLVNAQCKGSAKIAAGVNVYQYYLTDEAVGMYFDSSKPSEGGSCIAAGMLITLANGEQVPVESLVGDERLLVWNLYTGEFDSAPILFIDREDFAYFKIINLYFSDGTYVKVIDEHAFWDFDLNQYVFLREDASRYIGHQFNKQVVDNDGHLIWTKVQLIDVTITEEYTTAWSPVTYGHLCIYVNGMLSMPGATEGLINIFSVNGDTMRIDGEQYAIDIETYGLFTYEEFYEMYQIPETMYEAVNGKYLKVSIAKGLIDNETIERLIERYSDFFA